MKTIRVYKDEHGDWCIEAYNDYDETNVIMLFDRSEYGELLQPESARDLYGYLYGAYQCNDSISKGDEFALEGEVIARCEGVHVLFVDCSLWDDQGNPRGERDEGVQLSDESSARDDLMITGLNGACDTGSLDSIMEEHQQSQDSQDYFQEGGAHPDDDDEFTR